MANEIVPSKIQVPAHLANRLGTASALNQSIGGGMSHSMGAGPPRISIKGARFRIVEDGVETVMKETSLRVIIVGANPHLSKTWYEAAWDKDAEPSAPDCYSLDGIRPSTDSAKPQSDLCASCGQNVWGSKMTAQGQKIKACADKKRLAVVASEAPDGPIYLLEVTPAALKNFFAYHKELSVRGIPAEIVVTEVSFDTDASFPKLKFSFHDFISEESQSIVDGLFGTREVTEITGEAPQQAIVMEIAKPTLVKAKKEPITVETKPPEPIVPKRGFGAAKTNGEDKKPAKEPSAAPVVTNIADDISKLMDSLGLDDED